MSATPARPAGAGPRAPLTAAGGSGVKRRRARQLQQVLLGTALASVFDEE